MDLKITNAELIELNNALYELLGVDDLETLFIYRVSSIIEVLTPKLKAFEATRQKVVAKYPDSTPSGGGEAMGEKGRAFLVDIQTLLDAGVNVKVPTLSQATIHRMREDEGLPIKSSTIRGIRFVTKMDMELPDEDATANGVTEAVPPKHMSRAERVKATANAEATN